MTNTFEKDKWDASKVIGVVGLYLTKYTGKGYVFFNSKRFPVIFSLYSIFLASLSLTLLST